MLGGRISKLENSLLYNESYNTQDYTKKPYLKIKVLNRLGMVQHAFNPSSQEAEAGESL